MRRERQEALTAAGLTLDELKALLRDEEAARLSEVTQAAYAVAEAAGSESDWLEVTSELQESVLEAAGVAPEQMGPALWLLRSAAQLWPEDVELQKISCWVRHNRAAAGTLCVGDAPPDLPLHPMAVAVEEEPAGASRATRRRGSARAPASVASPTSSSSLASLSSPALASSVRRLCSAKPTLLVAGSFT